MFYKYKQKELEVIRDKVVWFSKDLEDDFINMDVEQMQKQYSVVEDIIKNFSNLNIRKQTILNIFYDKFLITFMILVMVSTFIFFY